jgi:hypothetical protein
MYDMGLQLYSLLKEVVLWIFIALKNPSTSGRFEPVNLGSLGEYITTRSPRLSQHLAGDTDRNSDKHHNDLQTLYTPASVTC